MDPKRISALNSLNATLPSCVEYMFWNKRWRDWRSLRKAWRLCGGSSCSHALQFQAGRRFKNLSRPASMQRARRSKLACA